MAWNHEVVLASLAENQIQELSIIKLSEPISAAQAPDAAKRASDVSTDAFENPSPTSLEADLGHYKELFSKLRFSYLEQVTKEKFLRAIVGDPPLIVEHQENVELESQLAEVKADLQVQKADVAKLVKDLEARGRKLSRCYENISRKTSRLSTLPTEISTLESTLKILQCQQNIPAGTLSLSLPLPATIDLLSSRQAHLDQLSQQLKTLQSALPRKIKELERHENELKPLEMQRSSVVAAAREATRRKEEGDKGKGDDLELKGRWHRGVEMGLRDMLAMDR